MVNPKSIFIWQGRIHLGDEPGIYGNAHYSGLSVEFPLTIKNLNNNSPAADTLKLELLTENVNIFDPGYTGHKVVIRKYSPDPTPANPRKWKEEIIDDSARIVNKATKTLVKIPIAAVADPLYLSVEIEVDTDDQPGFYDDFIFSGLNYNADNHYILFGFQL